MAEMECCESFCIVECLQRLLRLTRMQLIFSFTLVIAMSGISTCPMCKLQAASNGVVEYQMWRNNAMSRCHMQTSSLCCPSPLLSAGGWQCNLHPQNMRDIRLKVHNFGKYWRRICIQSASLYIGNAEI